MADDDVVVLLVDDEEFLRDVLKAALEDADFSVLDASDGQTALASLNEQGARVRGLVTDIDLGQASPSGWEIAREARLLNAHLPVIYMTGASSHDWAAMGVPGSILLAKPFVPAQLITALAQLMNAVPPMPE